MSISQAAPLKSASDIIASLKKVLRVFAYKVVSRSEKKNLPYERKQFKCIESTVNETGNHLSKSSLLSTFTCFKMSIKFGPLKGSLLSALRQWRILVLAWDQHPHKDIPFNEDVNLAVLLNVCFYKMIPGAFGAKICASPHLPGIEAQI